MFRKKTFDKWSTVIENYINKSLQIKTLKKKNSIGKSLDAKKRYCAGITNYMISLNEDILTTTQKFAQVIDDLVLKLI